MSYNKIKLAGVTALIEAVKRSSSLMRLSVANNHLSSSELVSLRSFVQIVEKERADNVKATTRNNPETENILEERDEDRGMNVEKAGHRVSTLRITLR